MTTKSCHWFYYAMLIGSVFGRLMATQDSSAFNLASTFSNSSTSMTMTSIPFDISSSFFTTTDSISPTATISSSTTNATSATTSTTSTTTNTTTSTTSTTTNTTTSTTTSTTSSTTSTTRPPTPSPSPPSQSLSYSHIGCLAMSASNITFTYGSNLFGKTNLFHLSTLFKNYTDHVDGCNAINSHRVFTRNYYESSTLKVLKFWFKFSFDYQPKDDSWTLTSVDSGNSTHKNYSFSYGNCGYDTQVPAHMSYKCSLFHCVGHERVSGTQSDIYIHDLVVDPYLQPSNTLPSKMYIECDTTPSNQNNNMAFLIVGVVIGATLVIAVLIIIGSFAYKRYRYGPYNLLD